MRRQLLRAIALVIALAGVVDPAITTSRRVKPEIGLVATGPASDGALVDRVARDLSSNYSVIRGLSPAASAVVAVGRDVPPAAALIASPVFAVVPEPQQAWVSVEAVRAPSRAPVQARVPIGTRVHVTGARGSKAVITLRHQGIAVDRVVREIGSDDERAVMDLMFVATAPGLAPLVVTAEVNGASARADLAIDVRDHRWAVLCFDGRPSWMSSFVRRALEADPRFVVTSRTATSRGATVTAGTPPGTLSALPPLALFDTVLVGAPETLEASDVAGLERYLRERGGTVVLLLDEEPAGHPAFERLAGVTAWTLTERARPAESPADSALESSADLTPREPAPDVRRDLGPAIWQTAVGSGRLIVSGALDAWRYRDRRTDAFDRWWRTAVAEAAGRTPRVLDVWLDRAVLAPGESTRLRARSGASPVDADVVVRAAQAPGIHDVEFSYDGARARAVFAVVDGARQPAADGRDALEQWSRSRGGQSFGERQTPALAAALDRALPARSERITWHPMRSAWWIVPFAIALGLEWTLRRRSGAR